MAGAVNLIVSDWGEFPAPDYFVTAWNKALRRKKRNDGRPDRRTREGRIALALERALYRTMGAPRG